MAKFHFVAAVLAVGVACVAGDYAKYETRTCTPTNDRCAGAEGYEYVKYAPCCEEGKMCLSAPALGWGRFCVTPPKPKYGSAPKCYKKGERCMGAPGKPYVEYHPCCDGSPCAADAAKGWGSFCGGSSTPGSYEPYSTEKCYSTGERCMGAPGKPYVTYQPCCASGESCVEDASMGWGSFCKASGYSSSYYGSPHTPTPPVTPPKDYYGKDYYKDTPPHTPTPPVTPPKDYYGKDYYKGTPPPPVDTPYYGKTNPVTTAAPVTGDETEEVFSLNELPPGWCDSNEGEAASANVEAPAAPADGGFFIYLQLPISTEDVCSAGPADISQENAEELAAQICQPYYDEFGEDNVDCYLVSEIPADAASRQLVTSSRQGASFFNFNFVLSFSASVDQDGAVTFTATLVVQIPGAVSTDPIIPAVESPDALFAF